VNVSLEQSIAIYARASRKWFGRKASHKTQERIECFARLGDFEGVRVHERVKQHILQLEQQSADARASPD
jgi:hypothetical protein